MSRFPNMARAFSPFRNDTRLKRVTKTITDFEVAETTEEEPITGMFYPMKAQDIAFKPEGQRAWHWYKLLTARKLALDDIIKDPDGVQYRVTAIRDWKHYGGYFEYDMAEQFTPVTTI